MHTLTVRLPDTVYRSARQLAEREGISLEQLIEAVITERASRPSDAALQQAYEVLAEDAETAEIEGLIAVQTAPLGSRLATRFAGVGLDEDIPELRDQPVRPKDESLPLPLLRDPVPVEGIDLDDTSRLWEID